MFSASSTRPTRRTGTAWLIALAAGVVLLLAPSSAFAVPPNDNFANGFVLAPTGASRTGDSNVGATEEPGEPNHWVGVGSGKSIWYTWTAPSFGQADVSLCGSFGGNFGPVVAVYTGSVVSGLTLVTSSTQDPLGGCGPRVFLDDTVAGTTYHIAADGLFIRPVQEGPVSINLKFTDLRQPGPNNKKNCKKGQKLKKVKGKRKCVKKKRKKKK
jgi:hypothetical protein